MQPTLDDLLHKVRIIAQTPYGGMLSKIIDSVFERLEEEYDAEPLSPEELKALDNVEAAVHRGDTSSFITLEEFEKKHGL